MMQVVLKTVFLCKLSSIRFVGLLLRHLLRRFMFKKVSPSAVMLALTYRCQFACRHCAVSGMERQEELDLSKIKELIDQMFFLGVPRVYFDGGEALLRTDFLDILSSCSAKGMISFLETNGHALDFALVKDLKSKGLACLNLTFHRACAEGHDAFTGREGSFCQLIAAVSWARACRLPVLMSVVVTDEVISSGELHRLMGLAVRLRVSAVRLTAPHMSGRWKDEQPLLTEAKRKEAEMLKVPGMAVFRRLWIPECRIGQTAYVSPSGEVMPCEFLPFSFGNVSGEELEGIIERMQRHEMFAGKSPCRVDCLTFRAKNLSFSAEIKLPVRRYR